MSGKNYSRKRILNTANKLLIHISNLKKDI